MTGELCAVVEGTHVLFSVDQRRSIQVPFDGGRRAGAGRATLVLVLFSHGERPVLAPLSDPQRPNCGNDKCWENGQHMLPVAETQQEAGHLGNKRQQDITTEETGLRKR